MEKEFIEKAKETGLPEDFVKTGLEDIRILINKGLVYPTLVEDTLAEMLKLWKTMPVY